MTIKNLSNMQKFFKRSFDICFSALGLFLTAPIILLAWTIVSIETCSNGFFIHQRVGRQGKLFKIIKIKTMKKILGINSSITTSKDVRIIKSGIFFRNTKIDELPQLWNVLVGEMSFVGPRPDVPGYANQLEGNDRVILSISPGITGPASLKYKDEELLLTKQFDPKKYNDEVIWPDKVKINIEYIKKYSFLKDLCYIWKSIKG